MVLWLFAGSLIDIAPSSWLVQHSEWKESSKKTTTDRRPVAALLHREREIEASPERGPTGGEKNSLNTANRMRQHGMLLVPIFGESPLLINTSNYRERCVNPRHVRVAPDNENLMKKEAISKGFGISSHLTRASADHA